MNASGGFTLIELMAASLIAAIVAMTISSLLLMGQKTAALRWKQAEIRMVADAVFADAAETLAAADGVVLGNVDEIVWEDETMWNELYDRGSDRLSSSEEYEILLYAKKEGRCHLRLTEIVMEGEEILWERSELLVLLNLNLREEAEIMEAPETWGEEMENAEFGTQEIWYRNERNW